MCRQGTVRDFRLKHSKNLIISHYNVNNIRHKFWVLSPLIADLHVDIFAIVESKLDDYFPLEQYNICNYKLHRQDRNAHDCAIMIYVNDCVLHRLIKNHIGIHMGIEFMTIELSVKSNKWYLWVFFYTYTDRPVLMILVFFEFLSELCEAFVTDGALCLFFGDINCNLSCPQILPQWFI